MITSHATTRQLHRAAPASTAELDSVEGTVEHGNAWGRVIGFPTANITVPGLLAHSGIWAARVYGTTLDPSGIVAAVCVGTRPTYYGDTGEPLLEAHLLDFSGDLYDLPLRVELHALLRPERKFVDTPALIDQLQIDVQHVREWFAAEPKASR
ncbi:riboflavin kinase [Cryobacterium frigoriphilum]|uniref:riboflavin kinase n=1 Tax=Cryobacterium frigoriphilum TaxID=1259150 RepID=A0A4R9A7G8_9MICO|nr:riboflavin kinase [Cryobacterium frigoriphilum]TFD53331.1 riboflavin kinase [Cryobacterium frigoriphilum]